MKTCTNCGYDVKTEDLFCGNCGAGQAMTGVNADQNAQALTVSGFGGTSATAVGTAIPVTATGVGTAGLVHDTGPVHDPGPVPGPSPAYDPSPAYGPGRAHDPGPAHDPPGPDAAQEAYFASTRSTTSAVPRSAVPGRPLETTELKYMRQTRNATVFIAVIVGIFTALAVIGVIYTAVTLSKLNSQINGFNNGFGSSLNSNCASQGGTNPNC